MAVFTTRSPWLQMENKKASISILFTLVVLTLASIMFSITDLAPAAGYGYGCTGDRPNGLSVRLDTPVQIRLQWNAVSFSNCSEDAADYYRLQIRRNDGGLVRSYDNIQKTHKVIGHGILRRNHAYKFRVRAVASDGSATDWSRYKLFRTVPKRPERLHVRHVSSHAVRVTWNNVARSARLRYYQVIVQRGDHVVFHKKVRIGLRRKQTDVTVRRLRPGTTYIALVRAVANKTTRSNFQRIQFTTLSE